MVGTNYFLVAPDVLEYFRQTAHCYGEMGDGDIFFHNTPMRATGLLPPGVWQHWEGGRLKTQGKLVVPERKAKGDVTPLIAGTAAEEVWRAKMRDERR